MTERRKQSRGLLPRLFVFAILLLGAYALWSVVSGTSGEAPREGARAQATAPAGAMLEARQTPPPEFPDFTVQVPVTELVDTQYLKLVNRSLALAVEVDSARLVTAWPDVPVRATYITLQETAMGAMRELFAAAECAGIYNLFIASGFRSDAEQRALYENAADRSLVLPPGHSEHQLGLAADILGSGLYHTGGMRGSDEARFLAEHAPRFGLILRYPEDKQDITGVAYEPWHFRYVGRIHAWYMGQNNLVLEEYIAYLQAQGGFQATLDDRTYYVLYQRPQNGMIFVPESLSFNVSGANTGGYIVTAWR